MDAQLVVLRDAGIDHLDAVINTVRGLFLCHDQESAFKAGTTCKRIRGESLPNDGCQSRRTSLQSDCNPSWSGSIPIAEKAINTR